MKAELIRKLDSIKAKKEIKNTCIGTERLSKQ